MKKNIAAIPQQGQGSSSLRVKSIRDGAKSALSLIDRRRNGELTSLKTSFAKLNKSLLNGVDWGRVLTIAGRSGSGKSTILEQLKRDFRDLNPKEQFVILSFEFEMLIEDQLARTLAAKTGIGVKDLYSAEQPLDDGSFDIVQKTLSAVADDRSYYVDTVGTVEQVRDTILEFTIQKNLLYNDIGLVVTIDHVLLTKGRAGDAEKVIVDNLMMTLVELKKHFASIGLKCIFVVLSQLNRDIEQVDRVGNRMLHYPTRNDIFGASSVYNSSDYVLISHRPADIVGMGEFYGPGETGFPKGLPVKCPSDPKHDMVYWHLIKERFGKPKLLTMVEDFQNSQIKEYNLNNGTSTN